MSHHLKSISKCFFFFTFPFPLVYIEWWLCPAYKSFPRDKTVYFSRSIESRPWHMREQLRIQMWLGLGEYHIYIKWSSTWMHISIPSLQLGSWLFKMQGVGWSHLSISFALYNYFSYLMHALSRNKDTPSNINIIYIYKYVYMYYLKEPLFNFLSALIKWQMNINFL